MSDLPELPETWEWSTIGDVAEIQLGRQRSPKNHDGPNMRPYLRSANVTWSGVDLSDVKEMNFEPDEAKIFGLRPGDLLLNEASGSPNEVGKPVIWQGEISGCCFQNTLLRVRSKHISTHYLYWYCYHAASAGRFGEAGRGVNIRHLGKGGLSTFNIPVAPRAEQERIVVAVAAIMDAVQGAEAQLRSVARRLGYELVGTRGGSLQRSTLASGFSGRLTTRDPDDEPAAVLLERIKSERQPSQERQARL